MIRAITTADGAIAVLRDERVVCFDADLRERWSDALDARGVFGIALSPDGSRLAVLRDRGVDLLASSGKVLASTREGYERQSALAWAG